MLKPICLGLEFGLSEVGGRHREGDGWRDVRRPEQGTSAAITEMSAWAWFRVMAGVRLPGLSVP